MPIRMARRSTSVALLKEDHENSSCFDRIAFGRKLVRLEPLNAHRHSISLDSSHTNASLGLSAGESENGSAAWADTAAGGPLKRVFCLSGGQDDLSEKPRHGTGGPLKLLLLEWGTGVICPPCQPGFGGSTIHNRRI